MEKNLKNNMSFYLFVCYLKHRDSVQFKDTVIAIFAKNNTRVDEYLKEKYIWQEGQPQTAEDIITARVVLVCKKGEITTLN